MTNFDIAILLLLIIIAAEASYIAYKTWRGADRPRNGAKPIFVDTSVLMDGRIVALSATGFIPGVLVVPRSVVRELQLLADKADTEKRDRARRGLDAINALQASEIVEVKLLQDDADVPEGVDERLLALAKKYRGSICTVDYNLNKVAQVEDIEVLNINDLAKQLRMSYLPGDKLTLELTQPGSDSHQAVGHLDDGTMVVVEQAKSQIGQIVVIEIIRSLQTAAGRMMFAKLVNNQGSAGGQSPKPSPKTTAKKSYKTINQPKSTAHKPSKQTQKSRPSKEDSLINLINQQSD